jgi:hemerythrin
MARWLTSWSTGIKKMDDQHKELLTLIDKLIDVGIFNDKVGEVLDEIIEYSSFHFYEEEKYLEKHQFPHYKKHMVSHQNLTQELNIIKKYFNRHGRFKQDPN